MVLIKTAVKNTKKSNPKEILTYEEETVIDNIEEVTETNLKETEENVEAEVVEQPKSEETTESSEE